VCTGVGVGAGAGDVGEPLGVDDPLGDGEPLGVGEGDVDDAGQVLDRLKNVT